MPPLLFCFFYLCTLSRGYTGFFLNLSLAGCTSHKDCPLTEACNEGTCQEPCLVWNPCAKNAICVNTNHGADCSCEDGYQGNGFSYCAPGNFFFPICPRNSDNRECIFRDKSSTINRHVTYNPVLQVTQSICFNKSKFIIQRTKVKACANTTKTARRLSTAIVWTGNV